MQPLAEAACELPWLAPCASSLIALTRRPSGNLWKSLRCDPGLVLLLARQAQRLGAASSLSYYSSLVHEPGVLELALECLRQAPPAFVDWNKPTLLPTYRATLAYAQTAEAIARQTDRCDAEHAWVGGLLAPLGWLAAACVQASEVPSQESGIRSDFPAIARRLTGKWRLPNWLSAVVDHLGLPVDVARSLGADPDHFVVVQLAVTLVEQAGFGLSLPVGAPRDDLARAVDLTTAMEQMIVQDLKESVNSLLPPTEWYAPQCVPLLPDLLQFAAENRRLVNYGECERLHCRVDALHTAVEQQKAMESQRLQELKLRSLAEFAAGAGHEINNPLAVISGQAQYLLVSEQEPARQKALQTIVGQSQKIHETLRQLRQFARPQAPQKQPVDLGGLLSEVLAGLQVLADDRQVRVSCENPAKQLTLMVDPCQMRTALTALLRNAIEAAPAGGCASLRVERDRSCGVLAIVEDNGVGLSSNDREHLFDPFYSGRKAGRGRGLGLPTAWQLARLHGGDVRFEPSESGPTRFVLSLPAETVVEAPAILIHCDGLNSVPPPVKLECPIPAA